MSNKNFILLGLLFLISLNCNSATKTSMVLNYSDFGPQAMAWEHIGMEWWQWESHGDSNPNTKYDIKIIVYRNIPLKDIKNKYPVIPKNNQDYRYLEYTKALEYLDMQIKENILPTITKSLKETKKKILTTLGN